MVLKNIDLAQFLIEEFDKDELRGKLKDLFSQKKPPLDTEVHALAEKMGIEPDKVEEMIYKMLFTYVSRVGRHRKVPDSEFNKQELEMGIKVELEHTDCKELAKEIAKDHLKEMPDYYSKLKKMENESVNEACTYDEVKTGDVIKLDTEPELGTFTVKKKDDMGNTEGVFLRSRYNEVFFVPKDDFDKKKFSKTGLQTMALEDEDGKA